MRNSPLQSSGAISQRGLFSLVMLLFSVSGLSIAMLSGAKLVFDILSVGLENSLNGLAIKVIVIGLAYFVGWATSMLAIRVYGNLVLPFIINIFMKISMHAIAVGGMLGIIIVLMIISPVNMTVPLFLAMLISGLVGTARMILGAHNGNELWIAFLLGVLVQIGAYYYLS